MKYNNNKMNKIKSTKKIKKYKIINESLNIPAGAFWAKSPIFEHHVLIANSESTEKLVKIPTCSSSGLAFCVELWPKQVWYRISVPMSYITANSFLFYCILVYSILFYFIFVHFI